MALTAKGVSFGYPVRSGKLNFILESLDLSLPRGEIVCLIGESGAGKSTILNLLVGLLAPTAGSVMRGADSISYLAQDDMLLPFRTVWQNAVLAGELRKVPTEHLLAQASVMLRTMKLGETTDSLPDQLSGGMKRRLALARQLLVPADIYLLDEPFGEQDRVTRDILEEMLFEQLRVPQCATLIVTHDLESAVAMSDRVIILGAHRRIDREWIGPKILNCLSPSERRRQATFAEAVVNLWHSFWEVTSRA